MVWSGILWSGVAVWLVGMILLVRSPRFLGAGLFASLLALVGSLAFVGGLERAVAPFLLQALVLGVFLPPSRPPRAPRVAPRRGSVAHQRSLRRALTPPARDTSSPLDLWDIPGYEVLEKVGSGGMASVFKARRKRDGASVALKLPDENFVSDEKFIRRFHHEAEVAQRLTHPNIVQTFEHGNVGAKHFMVMEFVEGYSLETYIEGAARRGDYETSCELLRQAVRALAYIHEAGVVHRDVKPANLMLRSGGLTDAGIAPDVLKLMDFGIAGGQVLSKLTVTGARVGTPTYMSPEQARGLRTDERSDIYSLGLVFYELLTGQAAFRGGFEVIVHQQIFQLPPPPRQVDPRIPPQLERLVMQMVAKEPEARPSLAEIEYRLAERIELPELEHKSRLLCAVEAPRGTLRVLDTIGNPHGSLNDIGASLPAPPQACVGDSHGNFFVAVTETAESGVGYPMIHKLAPDGTPLSAFGNYGMKAGEFLRPVALAVAPDDSLWVLDAETHRLEHFQGDGVYLGGFGGAGEGEGRFNDPRDLLVNAHGELFVLDYGNRQVQHFDPGGHYKNRWAFRASGKDAAQGTEALRRLSGFTLSSTGDLYLREALTGKVHKIAPRGGALDTLSLGQPDTPRPDTLVDMGVDEVGNLFSAERGGSAIRKYAPSGELLAILETYAPILQLRVDVRV